MTTRAQLRRYGNNLNQAARILNAGGDPPEWLRNAITLTDQVVQRIDRATQNLLDPPRRRT
ncbi:MAG: plasmid mobilization relaxosome protein MobC [Jiangellales bacterium]